MFAMMAALLEAGTAMANCTSAEHSKPSGHADKVHPFACMAAAISAARYLQSCIRMWLVLQAVQIIMMICV